MTDYATIHLRVPAAIKGRWIRASRAADDLSFSDLHLARDPDGALSFDWEPIERICAASGQPYSYPPGRA